MESALKGPRFLKVALGSEDFFAVQRKRSELEKQAQVSLLIAKKGEYYPYSKTPLRAVFVAGEEKNVLAALHEILPQHGNTNMTTFFIVPRSARGFLLGHSGEMMKKVEASTAAWIGLEHAGFEELVEVRGSSRAAAAVAENILLVQAKIPYNMSDVLNIDYLGCKARGMQSPCDVWVTIPNSQKGRFIGKNGETIKHMQQMFAVKMEVDSKLKAADGSSNVKISGALGDVHAAHLYVFEQFFRD